MKRFSFYAALAIMVLLSIPALKVGGNIRLGQLLILLTYMLFLVHDFLDRKVAWKILLFFLSGAVVMTLISLNSIEVKFGESKFFIKYFIIFPASYYVGYKLVETLSPKRLLLVLEIALAVYVVNALLIATLPLPEVVKSTFISYRTGFGGVKYLDYQGTFFEGGWFAMVVEATALAALLLRYEFKLWPRYRLLLILFYLFVFVSLVLSKNKTVWIALVFIALFFIVYKGFVLLIRTNYYTPLFIKKEDALLEPLLKLNTNLILAVMLFFVVLFFVVNAMLAEPIISSEMIAEKMQKERGKAFLIVVDFLERSHWFGGYGFGFVEAFFSLFPQDVIGLGKGSAMIFNSYLDVWLSASVLGLIFHLALVYLSSSHRFYFTMVIPLYFFLFANFNPAIGDEYYYLFLGLSYGVSTFYPHYLNQEFT